MKIKKGTIPTALGALLIAAALALTGANVSEDRQAERSCETAVQALRQAAVESREEPREEEAPVPEISDYVLCPVMEMPEKTVNGNDYIGTLEIPSLELELPIISRWSYPRFQVAPCRYLGSVYSDDLILAAHNYPSHFGRIKELNVGDRLIFTDVDGNVFTYQVAAQEILQPTDIAEMESGGYDLTLFTCTIGGKYRVTVRCDRCEAEV